MAQKKTGKVFVRMPERMETDLRAIAEEKGDEVAEILRWAAEAIIRCHDEYGDIPRDMEISQKTLSKVKRSRSAKG